MTAAENKSFPVLSNHIGELKTAADKKNKMFQIPADQENNMRLPNDIELSRFIETMNFYNFKYCKYYKTKFFRALLGVKKVTQHCPPVVWEIIPLQDITDASDIDWSKPISDIDQQLYRKYGLSKEEIDFIEKM